MRLGDDVTFVSVREEDFQTTFFEPFRLVFFCALAISEVFFATSGPNSLMVYLVILPVVVGLLCAAAVAIMNWRYHFELGPDGINSYDFWCHPHRTSWAQIVAFRYFSFLGVEYLLVQPDQSCKSIWIPLFVKRYGLLRDMLVNYAGQTHHLEERLPESEIV